jgi:hypothetical protein
MPFEFPSESAFAFAGILSEVDTGALCVYLTRQPVGQRVEPEPATTAQMGGDLNAGSENNTVRKQYSGD